MNNSKATANFNREVLAGMGAGHGIQQKHVATILVLEPTKVQHIFGYSK